MKLNLTATNPAEERILTYLEQNASETLAEKINNGTQITKDGKTLINRKTLAGFFKYATEEARKLATKGANFACIADEDVFGWSIHYFEEEAIEGEIFNLDGTPYKKIITPDSKKKPDAPKTAPKAPAQKPKAEPMPGPKAEPKKATILPTPDTKPTEDYQSLPKTTEAYQPKPTKKQKPTDPDQISMFDF